MNLPATEARRAGSRALDQMTPAELAAAFAAEDRRAAEAVGAASAGVARAIEMAADALGRGGRLCLTGAGTSGRLAVLEAAECLPTFSCDRVVAWLAGGQEALLRAREGAEDDEQAGRADVRAHQLGPSDLLLGVAASGRTPYVLAALDEARRLGAGAGLLSCAPPPAGAGPLEPLIVLETGPELLTGSTRLKAGTATKCVLNAITTGAMARLGKVYEDLMIDVAPSNAKLRQRAARIVATLAPCDEETARALLEQAGWEVKTAVVMGRRSEEAAAARSRLARAEGHLRRALELP